MTFTNRRFAAKPDMESSLFAPAPSPKEIDFYLSTEFQRVADDGSSTVFGGKRHRLVDEDGAIVRLPPEEGHRHLRHEIREMRRRVHGRLWDLVEIERRQAEPKPKKAGRPLFVPDPNHPWRKFIINPKKGVETSFAITTVRTSVDLAH